MGSGEGPSKHQLGPDPHRGAPNIGDKSRGLVGDDKRDENPLLGHLLDPRFEANPRRLRVA